MNGPLSDMIRLMSGVPFLASLGAAELRLIFALGTERHLPPGTLLGRGGERNDSVWILLGGQIEVASPLSGTVAVVNAPQVWGVASLVAPFTPTGSAITKTECRMLQVNAADIRQLAEQNPRLGSQIYLGLATHVFRRLRELSADAQRRRA
jgi:CRP-like cAMP-binding protein